MKEIIVNMIGIGGAAIAAYAALTLTKKAILESNKFLGGLTGPIGKLVQAAENRAKQTRSYQGRQMAKNQQQQERQRAATEAYAEKMGGTGFRSAMSRRTAAGGVSGLLFNRNRAGQQRVLQSALDSQRKQRHEEAELAAKRMKDAGFRGDQAYLDIAGAQEGQTLTSATGQTLTVTAADRQAAINNLVQQGRTSEVRRLEGFDSTGAPIVGAIPGASRRGAGGAAQSDLHRMLDHAYEDYGSKLGEKAPDLMPDRRTTEGRAAFTDLKPDDVAAWHHSTVSAAGRWYGATTDASGAPLSAAQVTERQTNREQMLRALAEATKSPGTRAKLSLDQVSRARDIAYEAFTSGAFDRATIDEIQDMYDSLGGTGARF